MDALPDLVPAHPAEAVAALARLAAQLCGMPLGLVWPAITVPGEAAALAAVLGAAVVPDTLADVRTQTLPAVTVGGVRCYVGVPLPSGTLCVLDYTPRVLSPVQLEHLHLLARQVAAVLALHTQAQRAHAALTGAEHFRRLAETIALQVWTATPDGLLDWANGHAARFFGVQDLAKEILGAGWTTRVHPEDLPEAGARWGHSLATGEKYETEFRLRGHDGAYRWFLVRAEPTCDTAGRPVKWFGSNTEVHELKVARQEAEAASRAKDNFLATLSHELRTPLTPVLMTAAALRHDARLPAEFRADLGMIERNIGLEARLIDDLLDLTRIARGKLQLRTEACDAHSLIGLAVDIVRDEAQTKPITLDLDLAAQFTHVQGDPARLQQVFWNLLRNAIKFTPRGGHVLIQTRDHPSGRLGIVVKDTGIGLAPEMLEKVFQPFEQAGLENNHRFGGLGLGLAIARAIVDLHGGSIVARSEGAGQGATFSVELPDALEQPTGVTVAPDEPAAPAPAEVPRPLRLLVVEDHEPTLAVLTRLLTRAGHQVLGAGSVAAAVAVAQAAPLDLVISDLGLPDGTGIDTITKVRHLQPGLPGIALSGYGMEEDVRRSCAAGFFTHLIKPIDFEQLRRAVREVMPEIMRREQANSYANHRHLQQA